MNKPTIPSLYLTAGTVTMEVAWLKTVVVFLNTDGAILVVSVENSGNVLRTEADRFNLIAIAGKTVVMIESGVLVSRYF